MPVITISKFKEALTNAGRIKGAEGVAIQKSLILEKYMIVDDAGMAVDPESLDVVIKASGSLESDAAPMPSETTDEDKERMEKSIRAEIMRRVSSQPKLSVTANLDQGDRPWERARVFGRLQHLKSKESAYKFGTWALATLGHEPSLLKCKNFGLPVTRIKGHIEGVNSQGGFLVPDDFENELITLREQYGVFRRNARVFPMSSDTKPINKRTATLTAYFVGEASAGTESQQSFDRVTLVAKKIMALSTISSELSEDNAVGLGDDLAGEIAYAFALKEDQCGFLGDGTSTYGGMVGLENALTNATYQVSDGGATAYSGVTVAEISNGIRKLPAWATQRNNVKIYCSKNAFHGAFERLAMAAGGVTAAEMVAGVREPRYFGYPIEFTQVIPVDEQAGKTYAFIGDLTLAAYFGDRRQVSIAFSDSALNAFEQDELAVRGTQRFDIICANVGSASEYGAMVKMTL